MKKLAFSLLAIASFSATSFAGQEIVASKEYKQPIPEVGCFLDQELQIDIFGAYVVGEGPNHAGYIRDHGWGGGIGVNYFFTRYVGIGVDGIWIYGKENAAADRNNDNDRHHTTFHNVTGSLIFRFPIDEMCVAPYLFVGGGFHVDGNQWGSAHAGLGLEFRVVPNKIGLFIDGRWTYFGDRFGHGDQNNFLGKAGIRFIF